VFLHHAHGALADFGGIFVLFGFAHHGSILLGNRASSKPGAIQVKADRGQQGAAAYALTHAAELIVE
jgi:hypothetical protein